MADTIETTSLSEAAKAGDFWLRGTDCDIRAIRRSDIAYVTFDNLASIDQRPDTPPWVPWLGPRMQALGYSVIGMQSHHKDWYRSEEPSAQLSKLVELGYFDQFRHVVFTGASMGGFAALCYAGLVPGARVLAFSPQSTLNRKIAPFEKRYPYPYRKFDWERPDYLDASDYLDKIAGGHIFYDPTLSEDRQHADRLAHPRLEQVRLPFAGHMLIRVIVKSGALEYLLETYPDSGRPDSQFFRLMRNKRENTRWAKSMLLGVERRGQLPAIQKACQFMHREYGYGFARRILRRARGAHQQKTTAEVSS